MNFLLKLLDNKAENFHDYLFITMGNFLLFVSLAVFIYVYEIRLKFESPTSREVGSFLVTNCPFSIPAVHSKSTDVQAKK